MESFEFICEDCPKLIEELIEHLECFEYSLQQDKYQSGCKRQSDVRKSITKARKFVMHTRYTP